MSCIATNTVCAKVADFGLSRLVAPNMGGALATWQWLAPEVLGPTSKHYDEKSDTYSFAIVTWEVVTRGYPFDEAYGIGRFIKTETDDHGTVTKTWLRERSVVEAIIHDGFRPTIPPSTNPSFAKLIADCWIGDAHKRPAFPDIVARLTELSAEF